MEILEKSVIVAAHPDDENLWFSSILSKVDSVVLCFLSVSSMRTWTEGRKKSQSCYPLGNVAWLELPESDVFWGVDWTDPIVTEYGLKITRKEFSDKLYRQNYEVLIHKLREKLRGYRNVYTHNPWGEYGHVEHVQVYRAVKALQQELQFNLWFTNYASNRSATLMTDVLSQNDVQSVTLQTEKALAESIADIYKANECWTWYSDYVWCDTETFIKVVEDPSGKRQYGAVLPINFIQVEAQVAQQPVFARVRRKVKGRLGKLFGPS